MVFSSQIYGLFNHELNNLMKLKRTDCYAWLRPGVRFERFTASCDQRNVFVRKEVTLQNSSYRIYLSLY